MYCRNCGNKLPEGARFCGACGAEQKQSMVNADEKQPEQLDSYELTDVSYSDENNCVISTRETYYVQVSGEALQLMTQECKYSLVKENGNWFMTSFVDINVVSRIKQ